MQSGVYRYPHMDRVIYGSQVADVLGAEVDRLDARAVFVLASGTLNRDTDVVTTIRRVLGNRCAGVAAKIGAHTPRAKRAPSCCSRSAAARSPTRPRWSGFVSATT
jgi:maleylacetate reductase